jgi:hypothetical protein
VVKHFARNGEANFAAPQDTGIIPLIVINMDRKTPPVKIEMPCPTGDPLSKRFRKLSVRNQEGRGQSAAECDSEAGKETGNSQRLVFNIDGTIWQYTRWSEKPDLPSRAMMKAWCLIKLGVTP